MIRFALQILVAGFALLGGQVSAKTLPLADTLISLASEQCGEQRHDPSSVRGEHRRLIEVKNKYDPMKFFRLSQNIKPSV